MNTDLVLVVDDDQAIVDALCMLLEVEGFTAEGYSGGDVIETITSRQPDLVLLDVWLAGEDGREICRTIKNDPLLANLPIILISASKDLPTGALKAGADDYIEKPFDIDIVSSKVRRLLEPRGH